MSSKLIRNTPINPFARRCGLTAQLSPCQRWSQHILSNDKTSQIPKAQIIRRKKCRPHHHSTCDVLLGFSRSCEQVPKGSLAMKNHIWPFRFGHEVAVQKAVPTRAFPLRLDGRFIFSKFHIGLISNFELLVSSNRFSSANGDVIPITSSTLFDWINKVVAP